MYCAAKAGVLGLMRGLRSTLPAKNISINMIAPWMTGNDTIATIARLWTELIQNPSNCYAAAMDC